MSEALTEYQRVFPLHTPTCYQQDLIEYTVTDLPAWRKALMFWASNDYRPQSIGKLLDYYSQVVRGVVKTFEVKRDTVGTSEPTYTPPSACATCGDELCLKDHRYAQPGQQDVIFS